MALSTPSTLSQCPHYALIFIDENGILQHRFSPSIAYDGRSVLSDKLTYDFLTAVARHARPRLNESCGDLTPRKRRKIGRKEISDLPYQTENARRPFDNKSLRFYYGEAFENLQQTNCRVLAKAYIKLVEPRKQVNYPYNGRVSAAGTTRQLDPEATKPPWWPSGVTHHEPDHLLKAERIRLLVSILCDLHTSHGITVERLRCADDAIRCHIFPPERLHVLDGIYRVREEEEKFLAGQKDFQADVTLPAARISRVSKGLGLSDTELFISNNRDQGGHHSPMYDSSFLASPLPSISYMKGPDHSLNGDIGRSDRSVQKHGHLRGPKKESAELEFQLETSEILMTPTPNNYAALTIDKLPLNSNWAAVIPSWESPY